MKRLFDLMAASAGLCLAGPIILLAMLAVRFSSTGPSIFAQTRVGRNELPFTCYKLRTMYQNTDNRPTHEVGRSAITPVGRFLRKTKLDELPQLVNVFKGDMSLVGPRPCLPNQTDLIEARRRHGVFAARPGITGLGQIRGIDMSQPVRLAALDGEYLQTRTFAGDLKILLATVTGSGLGLDHVART